jgi:hypothetical protein
MISEIMLRVSSAMIILMWTVSLACFLRHKFWENLCFRSSVVIFAVGFVALLCKIFGV